MNAKRRLFLLLLIGFPMISNGGTSKTIAVASLQEQNPILFIHGYKGSHSNWETMINSFADDGWSSSSLFASFKSITN